MHDPHALPGTDLVVDGVRLHVVRHGRDAHPGEPPILLLHGLGTSGRLWCDVARDLEHDHRSLLPDLACCGRSERPARHRRTPTAQAELLLRLLSDLGHDRAVIVGHDIGAAIGVHVAALAPERVAALVLVSGPVLADGWPPRSVAPLLIPGIGSVLTRLAALRQETPAGLRAVRDIATAHDTGAVQAALDVVATAPPPTLVLWGEDDVRLAPSYGQRIAAAVPGATWVPIAGAGHLVPAERPERVAEEIAGFLADVPARRAG